MRRYLRVGNWKMHKTVGEAVELARAIRAGVEARPPQVDVVVCPPFTALLAVAEALKGSRVAVGAQNMSSENQGAFTGEVSPVMLTDVGCSFVILGHSERRQIFGEDDEGVGDKVGAAVTHGLTPLICVGETLSERESGRTLEVIERQVERALRHLGAEEARRIVISYEPVWAIGTGHAASPEQAEEVQAFIRKLVSISHGAGPAEALRILYGGSVKPDNIGALMAQGDIDGALVGGACLQPRPFLDIVNYPRV
jgi:triosephosphate isomerase